MTHGRTIVFAVAVGCLTPGPLVAHHTGSFLYADKLVTLKGKPVTMWSMRMPK